MRITSRIRSQSLTISGLGAALTAAISCSRAAAARSASGGVTAFCASPTCLAPGGRAACAVALPVARALTPAIRLTVAGEGRLGGSGMWSSTVTGAPAAPPPRSPGSASFAAAPSAAGAASPFALLSAAGRRFSGAGASPGAASAVPAGADTPGAAVSTASLGPLAVPVGAGAPGTAVALPAPPVRRAAISCCTPPLPTRLWSAAAGEIGREAFGCAARSGAGEALFIA